MGGDKEDKRYLDKYPRGESTEDRRSGSRNRTSLRRKHIDADNYHMHERSKSAVSLEPHTIKHVEFKLHNHACGEGGLELSEKWFQEIVIEKDHIIRELEMQLCKKEEEIQYLVRQLDYIQTKYRQKKMQLSVLKNN